MKIGKVEIDEFVMILLIFMVLLVSISIGGTMENIEKEHTKQIELQTQIQQKEMENENYGNIREN